MGASDVAAVMLAFAAGSSLGFTLGRVFERWEFTRKGYRLPREEEAQHG